MANHPIYDELSSAEKENFKLVEETMRELNTDRALETVERELSETHSDFAVYLQDYISAHRGKKQIFAWYQQGTVCGVFCPADHSGKWFMRIHKLTGVGTIREATIVVLESLAAKKGLI